MGQKPYARACASSLSAPSFKPTSPNVTLHDSRKASAMVTVLAPPRQSSLPKFCSVPFVSGRSSSCGFGHRLSGPNPFSSAVDAVIILKVEPGRYSSSFALESSGLSGSAFSLSHAAFMSSLLPEERSFGSKEGFAYMARMSPDFGSIATTAPGSDPRASFAACCRFELIVVTTEAPFFARPSTRSVKFEAASSGASPAR